MVHGNLADAVVPDTAPSLAGIASAAADAAPGLVDAADGADTDAADVADTEPADNADTDPADNADTDPADNADNDPADRTPSESAAV